MMYIQSFLFVFLAAACLRAFCEEPPKPTAKDDAAALVKEGRAFFAKAHYAEALRSFEKALLKDPAGKEIRTMAAVSAYWAQQPQRALEYWNYLYDVTPRGGNEEWNLQMNRVMTLSALGKWEAVDLAILRLREIREGGKSKAARDATGFVRENYFGKGMRAGFWESLDERGESPTLWKINVMREVDPSKRNKESLKETANEKVATLAVETVALPGGGPGFSLSEEAGDVRRIYKYWTSRPNYAEVRKLVIAVLHGEAQALSEKPIRLVDKGTNEPTAPVAQVPLEILALGLSPQAEAIAFNAWKLNAVSADVSRLSRIGGDAAAFENYMREFNTRFPTAAATANELAEAVTKAKPEVLFDACDAILKFPARSAYLEFSLLTALNTRTPEGILLAFSKSSDAVVRQTSADIMGRIGNKVGLELLFSELDKADARGCEVIKVFVDELVGHAFDDPPNSQAADANEKLKDWKLIAAQWHDENMPLLKYDVNSQPGEPYWIKK